MQPANFPEANVTFGLGQPEYLGLPAKRHGDSHGHVTSCWHVTDEELAEIVRTRKVYVTVMTFHQPIQPQMVTTEVPQI